MQWAHMQRHHTDPHLMAAAGETPTQQTDMVVASAVAAAAVVAAAAAAVSPRHLVHVWCHTAVVV
jgi:hypothetical protein